MYMSVFHSDKHLLKTTREVNQVCTVNRPSKTF